MVGMGSARKVYLYSSSKVIKKAYYNPAQTIIDGWRQNRREVKIGYDPECTEGIARVYSWAEDYSWIISERVFGFKNEHDFKKRTGERWSSLIRALFSLYDYSCYYKETIDNSPEKIQRVIRSVHIAMEKHKLRIDDLEEIHHWGMGRDGRIVLLDYGW